MLHHTRSLVLTLTCVALVVALPLRPAHAAPPAQATETPTGTLAESAPPTIESSAPAPAPAPASAPAPAPAPAPAVEAPCQVDVDCNGEWVCEGGSCVAVAPQSGCTNDLQCKGGRMCVQGACQAPKQSSAAPLPLAPVGLPVDNWARGGGVAALVLGSFGVALGLAAELTAHDGEQIPSIPLGATATLAFAVATPVAAAGGSSARSYAAQRGIAAPGSRGMRITSWVLYGLTLTNAVALIGLGVAEIEPTPGQITLTTVLGGGSAALMAADAFKSNRQASVPSPESQGSTLRFVGGTNASGGAQFGVAGRF